MPEYGWCKSHPQASEHFQGASCEGWQSESDVLAQYAAAAPRSIPGAEARYVAQYRPY